MSWKMERLFMCRSEVLNKGRIVNLLPIDYGLTILDD